jgi:hypothetical protein
MPQKKQTGSGKRKKQNAAPISLHPLEPEEVLADLFRVKPEAKEEDAKENEEPEKSS